MREGSRLCDPVQFRGVLPVEDKLALVRGVGIPAHIGMNILLYRSTIMVHMEQTSSIVCGLDILQWYDKPLGKPRLTTEMGAVLEMITVCAKSKRARASRLLQDIINKSKKGVKEDVREKAWGLPSTTKKPLKHPLREPLDEDFKGKEWKDMRVSLDKIQIAVLFDDLETNIDDLTRTKEEIEPYRLEHRTRESLCRGACIAQKEATAMLWKPWCSFTAFSGMGVAVCHPSESLPEMQCVIMHEGDPVIGKFCLFRYPMMRPEDIKIWTAIEPPDDIALLPRNGVVLSTQGKAILVEGNYGDDDTISYTSDPRVLELCGITLTSLPDRETWEHELVMKLKSAERDSAWATNDRFQEFEKYVMTVQESHTRNLACAYYENAQYLFNASPDYPTKSVQHAIHILSGLAYAAHDVFHRYDGAKILAACRKSMASFKIQVSGKRSSNDFSERLSYVSEWAAIKDVGSCVKFFKLDQLQGFGSLGGVWLPNASITLGRCAGEAVHEEWHRMVQANDLKLPFCERSVWRSPVIEIARFLAHRAGSSSEIMQYVCYRPAGDMQDCFQREHRARPIRSWVSFSKKYALL